MSKILEIPQQLVFLSLGEEVLPLLKRGFLPLYKAVDTGLFWHRPVATKEVSARVSEADYIAHLKSEYARLPDSLRSLLTENVFIQQAEKKRSAIEAALLQQKVAQQEAQRGNADDWLVQRFYADPYSLLGWQSGGGLGKIWLGIDIAQWPEVILKPVEYRNSMPASFPQRLLADHPDMIAASEQRSIYAIADVENIIEVRGKQQGLLKLPPKALRYVLFGNSVNASFQSTFVSYWKTDFRYQRIPVAKMVFNQDAFTWKFTTV